MDIQVELQDRNVETCYIAMGSRIETGNAGGRYIKPESCGKIAYKNKCDGQGHELFERAVTAPYGWEYIQRLQLGTVKLHE